MRTFTYSIICGIILGLIGLMIGSGNSYYTKKSQQEEQRSVEMPLWAIVGCIAGLVIGAVAGNAMEEEEKKKEQQRKEEADRHAECKRKEAIKQTEIRRQAETKKALGFDSAETSFEGTGLQTTGVTKWTDGRNNNKCEVRSIIELERGGSGNKVKFYWIRTYVNDMYYRQTPLHNSKHQKKTREAYLKEVHTLFMKVIFDDTRDLFTSNADITVNDVVVQYRKKEEASRKRTEELNRLQLSGDTEGYTALLNRTLDFQ